VNVDAIFFAKFIMKFKLNYWYCEAFLNQWFTQQN
jgi:hypothetical protein